MIQFLYFLNKVNKVFEVDVSAAVRVETVEALLQLGALTQRPARVFLVAKDNIVEDSAGYS